MLLGRADQQPAGPPDQRASQVLLLVVTRYDHFRLLAADHPLAADLGIEMHIHLILKDGRFMGRQLRQQPGRIACIFAS